MKCPCCSGRAYKECCAPLHKGGEAPDPPSLMRARFAAFALGDAAYLLRTLHSAHEDRARPDAEILRAIKESARTHKYVRLAIWDAADDLVLFRAGVFHKGQDRSFVELSRFAVEGGWRYVDGEAVTALEGPITIAEFRARVRG